MRFKRFTAGIVAAVMAVTAVATPLGDNLPAVRESTSLTASAASNPFGKWQTINGVTTIRCTYYAWQQAYDNTGVALPMLGNGCQWYDNAKNAGYSVGTTAKARSIAVWGSCTNNSYGHVAYVVSVNGGKMTVNEGGRSDATSTNGIVNGFSCGSTIGSKRYSGSPLIGFIYLDSTPSTDNVKLLNTSSHYTDEVYDDNAIVHGEVNKPTSYPVTRIGIQVRKDGDSYSNGWSRFDNTQKTYTNSSWMSPWFNIKTELGATLVHCTRYYYKFYAVVNGKEYWSSENTFVTTGSHSYGSWYTKTSPTCTSGGTEERKCSCGATESRSTSALGHSYGSWYTSVNPGCTTAGTEKRVCSRCNSAETRSTSALGHSYSSTWTVDKPATCSAEGSKSRHCTRCDAKTEVTAIAKIAHTYTSKVVKPTLTQQGYTLHTCSVCGYSYKDNYTAVRENPSKVTGLAFGARSADYVSLKWNKDANADGYIVEYLSGNKFVKLVDKISGSSVSHKVTGLEAGTLYKFRIRSYVNVDGKRVYGEYSDVMNVRTLPKAMSNLKLGARMDNSISLKWDKNETANGAVVEMYKNGQWVVVATKTSNTAVSHKITGLKAGTQYKFRVRAYINDEGGRIYSVYNTTLNEATAPAAVKNFRSTITAKTAIRFNWDKNTTADGYSFEMIKNSKWTTVATIEDGTATNYSQLKLNPGTAYRFRIRAYKVVNGKKIFSGYSYVNASTAK